MSTAFKNLSIHYCVRKKGDFNTRNNLYGDILLGKTKFSRNWAKVLCPVLPHLLLHATY